MMFNWIFLKMNPNGLSLEMDVIIMFHKRFLTKNDRASILFGIFLNSKF